MIKNCLVCNKEYFCWPYNKKSKYCTNQCYWETKKLKPITDEQNLEIIKSNFEKNIIKKENDCWKWIGSFNGNGYGQLRDGRGNRIFAHRTSFELYNGPIPKNKLICHKCDHPWCCAPSCLFPGTIRDNVKDMYEKKRQKGQFKKGMIPHNKKIKNEEPTSNDSDDRPYLISS